MIRPARVLAIYSHVQTQRTRVFCELISSVHLRHSINFSDTNGPASARFGTPIAIPAVVVGNLPT